MLFALTFEQAQHYEPALMPVQLAVQIEAHPLIASGERVPTARGWHPEGRGIYRDMYLKPTRSWKRHRRHQNGSTRI
jgi:hypothetical protein